MKANAEMLKYIGKKTKKTHAKMLKYVEELLKATKKMLK
jgi:hypothetical protein